MPNRTRLLGMIGAVALGVAAGIWFNLPERPGPATRSPYEHIGGDFLLESESGPLTLVELRGKVVPIYFGFTHCPDICPTTLQNLGTAIGALPATQQANIHGLFVTLDPERDGIGRVTAYARHFGERITGLSGTPEQIAEAARLFRVVFKKVELPDSELGYTIDHSSRIYIVGREGQVQALLRHDATASEISAELARVAGS